MVGTEEAVREAQKELEALIKSLVSEPPTAASSLAARLWMCDFCFLFLIYFRVDFKLPKPKDAFCLGVERARLFYLGLLFLAVLEDQQNDFYCLLCCVLGRVCSCVCVAFNKTVSLMWDWKSDVFVRVSSRVQSAQMENRLSCECYPCLWIPAVPAFYQFKMSHKIKTSGCRSSHSMK